MIDRQEVARLAELARLELNEGEIEQYRQDLIRFLSSCAKLKAADVSQTEGTSHVLPLRLVLRADEVGASLEQKEVLAGAPEIREGFFLVPRIVEGQE